MDALLTSLLLCHAVPAHLTDSTISQSNNILVVATPPGLFNQSCKDEQSNSQSDSSDVSSITFFSDPPLAWLDRQVCNPQIPTVTSLLLLLLFWVFHIGTLQTFCNLCLSALHANINRLYAKRTLATLLANLLTGNNTRAIWRYTELVSQLAADSPVELPFVFSGKSPSRRWFLLSGS